MVMALIMPIVILGSAIVVSGVGGDQQRLLLFCAVCLQFGIHCSARTDELNWVVIGFAVVRCVVVDVDPCGRWSQVQVALVTI